MLKKIIIMALLLGFSSISFAAISDMKLIVEPKGGWVEATHYADISVNSKDYRTYHGKDEIVVSKDDKVSLYRVAMMNANPLIDELSCKNIRIDHIGTAKLLFELVIDEKTRDWKIYCQYYTVTP